jgi:glucosamine kinase
VALVADEHGTTLAEAAGPASAARPGRIADSAGTIAAVVREGLAAGNLSHLTPRVLCVGVAGVGREAIRQELRQALLALELADDLVLEPDYALALDDAFGDGPGVALIAGTGSVAFGRGPTGIVERCGGWGPAFGDEGSGAWIGRRALSAVTAAEDGREPSTTLTGAILTATQTNETSELIPWAAHASPSAFASLAPIVMRVADSGDRRAGTILDIAVEELTLHVRALARRLFGDERVALRVALSGGMLGHGSLLRRRVELRLASAVPGAVVSAEEVIPVRGAVRAALKRLHSAGHDPE